MSITDTVAATRARGYSESISGDATATPAASARVLRVCALTPEHKARTCGPYAYTVTLGAMAHTAFRTREALETWLAVRGLDVIEDIPAEGSGESGRIVGEYVSRSWLDVRSFWLLMAEAIAPPLPVLSNGGYTLGIVTRDEHGRHVINYLNPNADRPILDREAAQAAIGEREPVTWRREARWPGLYASEGVTGWRTAADSDGSGIVVSSPEGEALARVDVNIPTTPAALAAIGRAVLAIMADDR